MDKEAIIGEVRRLKSEKEVVILAHNYQVPEIQDIADFVGDSLELARKARDVGGARIIAFCGVRFMAETAKILNPSKKVLLPAKDAGCPLADMASPGAVAQMKQQHPGAWVVSYVNTTAAVKALTDVCCTSGNAVEVVRNVPSGKVIFLPDANLGYYVQKRVPEKQIILWDGSCFVHRQFSLDDLMRARVAHPEAEVLVHPECNPEVQDAADFILSTSGMLGRAKESPKQELIIGTEEGLIHRLNIENPGKRFYSLGAPRMCFNMKKTTLDLLKTALEQEVDEIVLEQSVMDQARYALEAMIRYV
jgi:quinolinate synthase